MLFTYIIYLAAHRTGVIGGGRPGRILPADLNFTAAGSQAREKYIFFRLEKKLTEPELQGKPMNIGYAAHADFSRDDFFGYQAPIQQRSTDVSGDNAPPQPEEFTIADDGPSTADEPAGDKSPKPNILDDDGRA